MLKPNYKKLTVQLFDDRDKKKKESEKRSKVGVGIFLTTFKWCRVLTEHIDTKYSFESQLFFDNTYLIQNRLTFKVIHQKPTPN